MKAKKITIKIIMFPGGSINQVITAGRTRNLTARQMTRYLRRRN